ncbi:hypothetical protein LWI29_036815 [Acer saccharum]|uniref:SWIM-type domain-containing protein n=1 Tax=Acer saccharum TaxID=4024 RepID=A0AA39RU64_ACESA|nr:hypothetical protein LWI29_036815 [Acer saccharum]
MASEDRTLQANVLGWSKPFLTQYQDCEVDNGRRKYHICRDRDVGFLLHTRTHCSEIYVDLVNKVRRDVREDHPVPQGTSQNSTSSNQASESVPTTQNVALTVEVPIWNGDYGIPDSFIDDSDEEGQGSGQNQRQIGSQFNSTGAHAQYNSYDVIPPHWVIPGADQYFINSPSTEVATSNVRAFYKGQIFHTKENLKAEFGKYALGEKFNPITKRSTQNQFENLSGGLKGRKEVLDFYRQAAYCYTVRQFDAEMKVIETAHQRTFDTLMSIDPERWSRCHCIGRSYNMMTTNIAESMNNCIKKARRLPITSAIEFLRGMLQKWFNDRREYLVKDGEHDSLVDIEKRTCSCREWDIFQLPCKHTIAVARFTKTNFNSFCHDYYSTSWLQTAYAPPINPVPYVSIWEVPEEVKCMIVLPPKSKRQSSRPKEIRVPSAGEVTRIQHCTKCGETRHNRLGCSNPRRIPSIGQLSTSISQDQPVRRQRACSVCHVLGHNRKTCPLVDRSQSTAGPSSDANTSQ